MSYWAYDESILSSSPIYAMYLKIQLASLQAKALASNNICYINCVDHFLSVYKSLDEEENNILCELYQHDLLLTSHTK